MVISLKSASRLSISRTDSRRLRFCRTFSPKIRLSGITASAGSWIHNPSSRGAMVSPRAGWSCINSDQLSTIFGLISCFPSVSMRTSRRPGPSAVNKTGPGFWSTKSKSAWAGDFLWGLRLISGNVWVAKSKGCAFSPGIFNRIRG